MNAEFHARSRVTLAPCASQGLDWFVKQMWRFCYLLTLLTDEVVRPLGLLIEIQARENLRAVLYRSACEIPRNSEPALPVLLFHLAHVRDGFAVILDRWFAASETMLDAIHLTMDAQRNGEHNLQARFILLAHATEVFSRATTSSHYMAAADYEHVIKDLTGAIPAAVTRDHRQSLKNRIKYGNEYSFRKRIRQLIDSLSPAAQYVACVDVEKFIEGISDTRNYYTHYTNELRPSALRAGALYWAAEKLSFLMRILLLRYLGINEGLIVDRLNSHPLLLQRIALAKNQAECISE